MRIKLARHVARATKMRNADRILVGKHDGKGPPGRLRHMCEDNIKMDVKTGCALSSSGSG
jgi:hypothetical protein